MHLNISYYILSFLFRLHFLDHAAPELEESMELAQAEEATNTELAQGKPRCIPQLSLDFVLITTLC
jgi:hypothetical protein